MTVVEWIMLGVALATVAGIYATVAQRDEILDRTASPELWTRKLSDYHPNDTRAGSLRESRRAVTTPNDRGL